MEEKSLFTYWKECFTQNYCNFEGRARRKEYWGFVLFQAIIGVVFGFAMGASVDPYEMAANPFAQYTTPAGILYIIFCVATFLPGLSALVRRLHDTNRSGWWALGVFIPIVNIVLMFVVLAFACFDGNPHTNDYGDDPKGRGLEE